MRIIPEYSLVVFPTPEQIALVKELKHKLRAEIGWFGSFNASAHITVMNFADESSLSLHAEKISSFTARQVPQHVLFDHYDKFGEKTFFIAPDPASQEYLDNLILDFHHYLGIKHGSVHAHISIARQLDSHKILLAATTFAMMPIEFSFLCDAFYLRKFNQQTKQYSDIVEKFQFLGQTTFD